MNIKSMLVRLEDAMTHTDLIEQMVLIPEPALKASKEYSCNKSVNLVVAYNASDKSQAALDLTLLIAHQTRLATQKEVTIQLVYVIEEPNVKNIDLFKSADVGLPAIQQIYRQSVETSRAGKSAISVLTKPQSQQLEASYFKTSGNSHPTKATAVQYESLEKAACILKQAQSLAEEWRGNFKAHLRFGDIARELKAVVESELATVLFLGCNSANHPLVQKCGANFPCSVLGVPHELT